MNLRTHRWKLLRCGAAAVAVLAAGLLLGPRTANAQTETLDFTINSDINSPTTTATIAASSTYTVDVWLVFQPGANSPGGATAADLGFVNTAFGARSSTTATEAIAGGTASSAGGNAGVGITAFTTASGFSPTAVSPGDWNGDGVNDISSLSVSGTTLKTSTTTTLNYLGGNSQTPDGEAVGSGWAWEIGTFTITTGATIGANGSNTTFTPSVPTFNGVQNDWTFNGGTSQVSNKTAPTAYPLLAGSAVTFNVGAVVGNTSVLNLTPNTLTFNLLTNSASPSASQNLTLSETSSTGAATYTGVTAGNFNVNNGASGSVSSGGSDTLATTYTGSTAANGSFTGSYTATNTSGSTATQGNLVSNFTVHVGNATDDTTGTGSFTGTVLTGVVGNTGSYAGLASSSNSGTKAANPTSGQPGIEGSTATILQGTNNQGSSMTVSMTWRSRLLDETPKNDATANGSPFTVNGTPTAPPLPNGAQNPLPLISDVVNLYGMSSASTGASPGTTAPVQVDPFAFEMSFNPATLIAEGASGNKMASHGQLYLASLMPFTFGSNTATVASGGTPYWANTIIGDFEPAGGTTATYKNGPNNDSVSIDVGSSAAAAMIAGNPQDTAGAAFNFPLLESYATFLAANSAAGTNLANYIGVWGVDTTNDEAWAVINHNSEFAVVPEPSTIALAIFGLAGIGLIVSKRKKLAA